MTNVQMHAVHRVISFNSQFYHAQFMYFFKGWTQCAVDLAFMNNVHDRARIANCFKLIFEFQRFF